MKLAVCVLLGVTACRGAREEGAVAGAGSGSVVSPPRQIPSVPSQDAAKPTLIDDMVSIPSGKSHGRVPKCDHPRPARATDEPVDDSDFEVNAFQIDRRPVSCVDFQACVDSGACKATSNSGCEVEHAYTTHSQASSYCKWRGARLPEYVEWQRAIRGAEGRVYVTGGTLDDSQACKKPRLKTEQVGYCEQVTAEGVVFATRNMNLGEWTRTTGCYLTRGERAEGPVAVDLLSDRLDLVGFAGSTYEFRCARNL